jgi:hypothetical protein
VGIAGNWGPAASYILQETIKEAMSHLCLPGHARMRAVGQVAAIIGTREFESRKIPDISVSMISTNVHGMRQQIPHFH